MKLSKTNFQIYRDCPHNAWLKMHRPEIYRSQPVSAFDQAVIDTGNEVDELARALFPGGALIERGDAQGTRAHVATPPPSGVLYQPVFETERFTVACDILVWNAEHAAWDLYEVKSSTSGEDRKAKDLIYAHDIAFQAEVLRANGLQLGRLYLVRLNGDYVRGEQIDVAALFTREDFTERAQALLPALRLEMDAAFDVLTSQIEPAPPCKCMFKGRSGHCTTFAHTNPQVPSYSVHDITRIGSSPRKLKELIDGGILRIEDVPEGFPLSPAQASQVQAARSRRPSIDRGAIAAFLDGLRYPIAFLDYETFPCAVPRFAGYRPYEQIPFQFSLDIVEQPDGPILHREFLHTGADNPDRLIIAALAEAMPASGSIVVWNEPFERGINALLGGRVAEAHDWLASLEPRIVDLMDVFSTQAYVHPDFRGRTSIKYVLPVLVPDLSYEGLAIREGATASTRWNEIVTGAVDPATARKLREELLAYCGLDTRAMVEIWRALLREAQPLRQTG